MKRPIGWLSACSRHEETQVNFQHVQSMRNIAQVSTCLRHEETHGEFQLWSMRRHRSDVILFKAWRYKGWLSACSKHEGHSTSFNLFKAWRDTWRVSALKHEEAQLRLHPVQSMKRQRVTFSLLISKHERHSISFNLFEAWRDTGWVSALKHGEAQVRCHPVQSMKRQRVTFSLKHEEPQVNFQPVQSMRHTTRFNLFKAWRDMTNFSFEAWGGIDQISSCSKHEETYRATVSLFKAWRDTGQLSACSKHEEYSRSFNLFKAWRDTWRVSALKHEEAQLRFQ